LVTPLSQQNYGNSHSGWVNARYLRFLNQGYVTVKGKKEACYYSLECQNGYCKVVAYMEDKGRNTKLHTVLILRKNLIPTDRFGAADPHSEGYCVTDHYIKEYLK